MNPSSAPSRSADPAAAAAARAATFDAICKKHGFTPVSLTKLEPDRLKELVCAEGHPVPLPSMLPVWAKEYAESRAK